MLGAGLSYLQISRLKDGEFVLGRDYSTSIPINDLTEKVYKKSFFITLSYSLTNRIEIK